MSTANPFRKVDNEPVTFNHVRTELALRERTKELQCLYRISRLVRLEGITLDEMLQGIVELLPPAWLYPEIASARLQFAQREYHAPRYAPSAWSMSAALVLSGRQVGLVEVVYRAERPEQHEGPFMQEERLLLNTIAEYTCLALEARNPRR